MASSPTPAYFEAVSRFAADLSPLDVAGAAMLDLVARSVEIKADVVRRDEREDGVRKTLNFGHTIGHAVELCSEYALLHGDAVAIGMVYESLLAERVGDCRAWNGGARFAPPSAPPDLPDALPGIDRGGRRGGGDARLTRRRAADVRSTRCRRASARWRRPSADGRSPSTMRSSRDVLA